MRARLFDVKRLETTLGHARLAIVVPKFGFTAVRRNRLKRRIRELGRTMILPRAGSWDLFVRARREAYDASFADLREDVSNALAQLA